ncbi:hypothetical protein HDU93_002558 [Gonapodya sp. JEL0774]|nr:hypothetical protein HDU93_002558 [Gonapodya sp. JEL0774]
MDHDVLEVDRHGGSRALGDKTGRHVSDALNRALGTPTNTAWIRHGDRLWPSGDTSCRCLSGARPELGLARHHDYRMLAKNQRYQRDLVESIRTTPDPRLPVLRVCKSYFGFRNGIYNIETCEFTPRDKVPVVVGEDVVVRKYLDQDFLVDTTTPEFDSLLRAQVYGDNVLKFVDMCLGRLFGIRDNWQFMLLLFGTAVRENPPS